VAAILLLRHDLTLSRRVRLDVQCVASWWESVLPGNHTLNNCTSTDSMRGGGGVMAATRKAEGQAVQYCMVCGACCLEMGVKTNVPQGVKLCGQVLQL
jgi:hypothetical protein